MTRNKMLSLYHPIRAEIRRHLSAAPQLAEREDWLRLAEDIGLVEGDKIVADDDAFEMLTDAVLFTPHLSQSRIIDCYAARLTDRRERAFARRLAKGVFSVWRILGRHPHGGVMVDDMLGQRKRKHLMDEGLEKSAREETLVAMRLFDAGPFLAGFGIVIPISGLDTSILREICRGGRPPDLHIVLYGHAIHGMSFAETLFQDVMLDGPLGRLQRPGAM